MNAAKNEGDKDTSIIMAKTTAKLTYQRVGSATLARGLHGDGNNLFLRVKEDGLRSWVFIYRFGGKQRELGLGRAGEGKGVVSLKAARKTAPGRQGPCSTREKPPIDPHAAVWRARPAETAQTFAEAARDYLVLNAPTWKSRKHAAQWRATISTFCQPLHKLPVDQITVGDVRAILNPLWARAPETASRVRNRIAAVIDHSMPPNAVQLNPAKWLAGKFPKVKDAGKLDRKTGEHVERGNFSALPHKDAPRFAQRLRAENGVAERALEFTLLTAARTAEVIGAKWSEIDHDAQVWTIPPARLKTGKRTKRSHIVPLSSRALAIVEEMRGIRVSDYIFPGHYDNAPLNTDALRRVAKRLDPTITTHGFRSCFVDWAAEKTEFSGELVELSVGHIIPGVRAHYRRETGVEQRRKLMCAWDAFLAEPPESVDAADNILTFAPLFTRSA